MPDNADTTNTENTDTGAEGATEQSSEGGDERLLDDRISKITNKAISTHLSRVLPSMKKDLTTGFGEMLAPIVEQLSTLKPTQQDTEAAADAADNPALQKLMNENKKMAEQLKQVQTQLQKAEAEKQREHETRLRNEERSTLNAALSDHGITGARARAVAALLLGEERVIKRDEEQNIVFEIKRNGYEEHFSVGDGVAAWLDTDEGREFLPARGARGSGAGASKQETQTQRSTKPRSQMTQKEKVQDAWREVDRVLRGGQNG